MNTSLFWATEHTSEIALHWAKEQGYSSTNFHTSLAYNQSMGYLLPRTSGFPITGEEKTLRQKAQALAVKCTWCALKW
jgi:hypothetical protein